MPTDQLLHPFDGDADMDRAMREILPPMPRSTAWEAHQRDALLTFIQTGDVGAERPEPTSVDAAIVSLDAPSPNDRRRRAAVVLGMAAAAVLLAAGLVTAPRWRGQEIPPATAPAPVPVTTPPAPSDELLLPDLFPILPDDHPLADGAIADYGSVTSWDNPGQLQALVAIEDGARLTEAVLLQVYSTSTADMWRGLAAELVTAAGVIGTLYTDRGTAEIKTFVVDGEPALAVHALDPVAFVEAAGGIPIVAARVGVDGVPTFDVGSLPDGYDVIIQPGSPWQGGVMTAWLRVTYGDEKVGVDVFVGQGSTVMRMALLGDTVRVDLDGGTAWQVDRGPRATVFWQVSDDTWAHLIGTVDADTALELARSVQFVDRSTWEQRYGVELGAYPTREELEMIPATTAPSLIALEEIGVLPTDVPIACGSIPPTDESVSASVVAATPQEALAEFVDNVEPGLWRDGWIHTWNGEDADPKHRFDYRREDGQLVTVVYVEAVDGGWAATRWLSTPC